MISQMNRVVACVVPRLMHKCLYSIQTYGLLHDIKIEDEHCLIGWTLDMKKNRQEKQLQLVITDLQN